MDKNHQDSHSKIEKQVIMCKVIEARHVGDYIIHVKFNDDVEGDVNLENIVNKGVFQQIKDVRKFLDFSIDHGAVTWNRSLDIAPEYLYEHLNRI